MQSSCVGVVQFEAARARVDMLPGDVMRMRLHGLLTREAMESFAYGALEVHAQQARGLLFDYTEAVMLAGDSDLRRMVKAAPHDALLRRLPGALVGTEATAGLLREHAIRLALAGVTRRAFVSVDDAHLWVVRKSRR